MKKEEYIERYGEEAYEKILEQKQAYHKANKETDNARSKKYREEHPEQVKARNKKYNEEHPEQVKTNAQEQDRKGGKRYEKHLEYQHTGLQGDRNRIRNKHNKQYKPYKDIIAPASQIHHEWVPDTSEYRGVALVEKDQHMHGIVDVIEILDGEITLRTEEEVSK
jgi:exonuclease VII large subunit